MEGIYSGNDLPDTPVGHSSYPNNLFIIDAYDLVIQDFFERQKGKNSVMAI